MFSIRFLIHESLSIRLLKPFNSSFTYCHFFFKQLFDLIVFALHVIIIWAYFFIWLARLYLYASLPSGLHKLPGISGSLPWLWRSSEELGFVFQLAQCLTSRWLRHEFLSICLLLRTLVKPCILLMCSLMLLNSWRLPTTQRSFNSCLPTPSIQNFALQRIDLILKILEHFVLESSMRLHIFKVLKLLSLEHFFTRFWKLVKRKALLFWHQLVSRLQDALGIWFCLESAWVPMQRLLCSRESLKFRFIWSFAENIKWHYLLEIK